MQWRFAGIGHEHGFAFEDIDELVFARVRMTERRYAARRQTRHIYPKTGETERIAERPSFPPRHARGEGLGVAAAGAVGRQRGGVDGDWLAVVRHGISSAGRLGPHNFAAEANRRKASAVAASAGRNASIAISDKVMSTGVPNTVVMLIRDRVLPPISSRSGTTMSSYSAMANSPVANERSKSLSSRHPDPPPPAAEATDEGYLLISFDKPASTGSPVRSSCRCSRATRCARHSAKFMMRGASPAGWSPTRSALTGGFSTAGSIPANRGEQALLAATMVQWRSIASAGWGSWPVNTRSITLRAASSDGSRSDRSR